MGIAVPANEERLRWLWTSKSRYFIRRHRLRHEHDRWRKIAELLRLSRAARGRLECIIFWENNRKDVSLTARHFGISRKTFYKWSTRFEKDFLRGLEDGSRTPHRRRRREYTARQYENVVFLRRQHLRYGKMKLLELYRRQHPDDGTISAWKVQCIIHAFNVDLTKITGFPTIREVILGRNSCLHDEGGRPNEDYMTQTAQRFVDRDGYINLNLDLLKQVAKEMSAFAEELYNRLAAARKQQKAVQI